MKPYNMTLDGRKYEFVPYDGIDCCRRCAFVEMKDCPMKCAINDGTDYTDGYWTEEKKNS